MIIITLELTALPIDARFMGPPCLPERSTYAHVRYVHATVCNAYVCATHRTTVCSRDEKYDRLDDDDDDGESVRPIRALSAARTNGPRWSDNYFDAEGSSCIIENVSKHLSDFDSIFSPPPPAAFVVYYRVAKVPARRGGTGHPGSPLRSACCGSAGGEGKGEVWEDR